MWYDRWRSRTDLELWYCSKLIGNLTESHRACQKLLSHRSAPLSKAYAHGRSSAIMETTPKLWDLNRGAQSPEKADFLLLSGCNKPPWKEKRRRKGHNKVGTSNLPRILWWCTKIECSTKILPRHALQGFNNIRKCTHSDLYLTNNHTQIRNQIEITQGRRSSLIYYPTY